MAYKHASRTRGFGRTAEGTRTRNPWQKIIAVFGTMLLGISAIVGTGVAAQAATPGIDITVLAGSPLAPVADGAQIPEGTPMQLQVQYNATEPIAGLEVEINVGSNINVGSLPAGNVALESIEQTAPGVIKLKFKDPLPPEAGNQGVIGLNFTAAAVTGDQENPITWSYGDETGGVTITVKDNVTPPTQVSNGLTKAVAPGNLDSYVLRAQDGDGNYYYNGLNPAIKDVELEYTLVLTSEDARTDYPLSDILQPGLSYIPGSFTASLREYNPTTNTPYTFSPTITPGATASDPSSFSGTVTVPENSRLEIKYKAQVLDDANLAILHAALQAAFDARGGATGDFQITVPNVASASTDHTATANVRLRGNVPGPGIGNAFDKTGSWTHLEIDADATGAVTPPAEIIYTLTADLRIWDNRNAHFTLTDNVVISDTLPAQASWNTAAVDFITSTGLALAQAADCPARAAFAADAYVGQWCVDGQTLLVNVGKNPAANPHTSAIVVNAKALLNSVSGLTEAPAETRIVGATAYALPNAAQFWYTSSSQRTESFTSYPIVLPEERDGGLNDSASFAKTVADELVTVLPGERATVDYVFTVDTAKDSIDPLESTIVDYVDTTVFDIGNPSSIAIHGTYGAVALVASDFELSVNGDGNLEIVLSDAGKAKVSGAPEGEVLTIHLPLVTHVLGIHQTFEITNRATLFGESGEPLYWSEVASEATSFGDEAEVRKRLWDLVTEDWTDNINAELDEDGAFINDVFVYRVQFIPRGNYNNVVIFDVIDQLPSGIEFLGFVDPSDTSGASPLPVDTIDIGGNLEAVYDEDEGTVTITQKDGTRLDANAGPIAVYFAVRAVDSSGPIVNEIGPSSTTITPFGAPSIDIEKWNDEGETPEYDAAGAIQNDGFAGDSDTAAEAKALKAGEPLQIRFTISNDGLDNLTNIVVSDELLADSKGAITNLSCDFSTLDPDAPSTGTTWAGPFLIGTQFSCTGTLPALEAGDIHANRATVTAEGIISGGLVEDDDEWHAEVLTPSIDIEKWTDEGASPLYDADGKLTNDGYAGDFDTARGKKLEIGKDQVIRFTISNDGLEPLVDIKVGDTRTGGVGDVQNVVCDFAALDPDAEPGLEWAGPFEVGAQFHCTGILPGLAANESHSDRATVTAVGATSGIEVDDADEWHGYTEAALSDTGAQFQWWIGASGAALLLAGGVLMLARRRTRV